MERKKNYRQKCNFCHFEKIGPTEFFNFFVRRETFVVQYTVEGRSGFFLV